MGILYLHKFYFGGRVEDKWENFIPVEQQCPISSSPPAPGGDHSTLFMTILDLSYSCSHAVFFLLWLAYFI